MLVCDKMGCIDGQVFAVFGTKLKRNLE